MRQDDTRLFWRQVARGRINKTSRSETMDYFKSTPQREESVEESKEDILGKLHPEEMSCGDEDKIREFGGGETSPPEDVDFKEAYTNLQETLVAIKLDDDFSKVDWETIGLKEPKTMREINRVNQVLQNYVVLNHMFDKLLHIGRYPEDNEEPFIQFLIDHRIESIHELTTLSRDEFDDYYGYTIPVGIWWKIQALGHWYTHDDSASLYETDIQHFLSLTNHDFMSYMTKYWKPVKAPQANVMTNIDASAIAGVSSNLAGLLTSRHQSSIGTGTGATP